VPKLNEYVKVVESAEILGVSLWTVRTWATDAFLQRDSYIVVRHRRSNFERTIVDPTQTV